MKNVFIVVKTPNDDRDQWEYRVGIGTDENMFDVNLTYKQKVDNLSKIANFARFDDLMSLDNF